MALRFAAAGMLAAGCAVLMSAAPLHVMTFNVRMPAKSDGPNVWENRRDVLVAAIRASDPDLIGTQELFQHQGDYIVEKAPAYTWFGLSRRGNHDDEHMGVFYKKDKLRLLESGDFWLSETPGMPGSMSWNVTLPRMVTWGLFEVRSTGRRFYFFNTHFAHRREDEPARVHSARVITKHLGSLPHNVPVVLTGDFNTGVDSEPYNIFRPILDEVWAASPERSGPVDTFHGFTGRPRPGRIDWIWYRGLRVRSASTVTYNQDGRYPSDHFPVSAVLEFSN